MKSAYYHQTEPVAFTSARIYLKNKFQGMFTVSALTHGAVEFVPHNPSSGVTNPAKYIPGSEAFEANHHYGNFLYQRVEQKDFTLWKSVYMPTEDLTFRVQRDKPWVGLRLVLRKSVRHVIGNRIIPMLQGQFNMAYMPYTDNSFHLKKDEQCEVVDLQVSRELLERIMVKANEFDTFLKGIGEDAPAWIRMEPVFGGALVLDALEELMEDPRNEQTLLRLLQEVVESLTRPSFRERVLSKEQVERLFVVRELLRTELSKPGHLNDWAMRAQMNTTYFKEMFRQVFVFSPHHYLLYERIRTAEKLIREQPDISVSELVTRCGFKHYNNLRRTFYAKHKKTISDWKDLQQFFSSLWLWESMMEDIT